MLTFLAALCFTLLPLSTVLQEDLRISPLGPHAWLWVHEKPFSSNGLLWEMEDQSLVLVSTPYTSAAAQVLLRHMRKTFGARKVVAINPHFHADGLGGNAALRAAGIPTYGSDLTVAMLAARGAANKAGLLEWLQDQPVQRKKMMEEVWLPPDHVFPAQEGLTLHFGPQRVEVMYPGPAHSPDNVAVYSPSHSMVFGGCMLIAMKRVMNKTDADLAAWPQAVERLRVWDAAVWVPGHGAVSDKGLLDLTLQRVQEAQP